MFARYRIISGTIKQLVIDDVVEYIAAARRTRRYEYEAVFVQSGLDRDSYLDGIVLSQVSSSRLPVNDDVV